MLDEKNVRKGFFEHHEFLKVREEAPDYLKPVLSFAYFTGWRRGEILNLTWEKVDLRQGTVRFDRGETKNDEARSVYLDDELMRDMVNLFETKGSCPFVFHHGGKPILKFEKAWNAACERAEVPDKLFHDFRRTAVRNMVRSGIPERVAMMISGHKTRSVFDRYNIVNDSDLKEASKKQSKFIEEQNKKIEDEELSHVTNLPQLTSLPFASA
jgi:integrase